MFKVGDIVTPIEDHPHASCDNACVWRGHAYVVREMLGQHCFSLEGKIGSNRSDYWQYCCEHFMLFNTLRALAPVSFSLDDLQAAHLLIEEIS